jgi:hypothetical protein
MVLLPEDPAPAALSNTEKTLEHDYRGGLGLCQAGLRGGAIAGRKVVKSYLSVVTMMGERFGMDQAQV